MSQKVNHWGAWRKSEERETEMGKLQKIDGNSYRERQRERGYAVLNFKHHKVESLSKNALYLRNIQILKSKKE